MRQNKADVDDGANDHEENRTKKERFMDPIFNAGRKNSGGDQDRQGKRKGGEEATGGIKVAIIESGRTNKFGEKTKIMKQCKKTEK